MGVMEEEHLELETLCFALHEDCIDCNTFECPNCRGNHYCDDAIII